MIAKVIPIVSVKKQLSKCDACPYVDFVEEHLEYHNAILLKFITARNQEECPGRKVIT